MTNNKDKRPLDLRDEVSLCAQAADLEPQRVRELAEFAAERKQALLEALVERGGVSEDVLLQNLSRVLGLPFLGQEVAVADETLQKVPASVVTSYTVMPIGQDGERLRLAYWNPFDWQQWDELSHLLGCRLEKVLCPRGLIRRMIKASYGVGAETVDRLMERRREGDEESVRAASTELSEAEAANEPTVVNLVNQILMDAIRANATDIHFEPYENKYRVRYRIDGMLEDVSIPVSVRLLRLALVSRIKIMSNLDITEKRLPQDGRCNVACDGQEYDLRISILPGIYGEAVVVRLQSRQMVRLDLDTLGFEAYERQKISEFISHPYGIMLVTGPTGSGKTTTLYACLHRIIRPEVKILTVEDPVEYWMEDILQMQVHPDIGFTFARALRSMLRHDPDIMLVGEIRDQETADIAIRASLTGHLVFATLHTNDAASAMTRLIDIGIEPFLVASSTFGVLAQRLVRRICEDCKEPAAPESLTEIERQVLAEEANGPGTPLWRGRGCERCRFTGYRGRRAVGETLTVSARIRQLVHEREPAEHIRAEACREGMRTLRANAVALAAAGRTTISEVLRVTQGDLE